MDFRPILQKLYPEGSKQGECGVFAHRLVAFPLVGDSLKSKIAGVGKYGILAKALAGNFRPGDVLITSESKKYGHVAVVNFVGANSIQLTESNYHLDGRVHHTRVLPTNAPAIIGVIRGFLNFNPEPIKKKVKFPIVIQIKLVANNAAWQSFAEKFKAIRQLILDNSAGRLDVNIDVDYTTFKDVPSVQVPGFPFVCKAVDNSWFDKNINPHGFGKYHMVCFLQNYKDVPPNGVIFGFTMDRQEDIVETELFCDETMSVYSKEIGTQNLFVNSFIHENFGHGLKLLTGQPDNTHQFMYLQGSPNKWDLKGFFDTLDYQTLFEKLNP